MAKTSKRPVMFLDAPSSSRLQQLQYERNQQRIAYERQEKARKEEEARKKAEQERKRKQQEEERKRREAKHKQEEQAASQKKQQLMLNMLQQTTQKQQASTKTDSKVPEAPFYLRKRDTKQPFKKFLDDQKKQLQGWMDEFNPTPEKKKQRAQQMIDNIVQKRGRKSDLYTGNDLEDDRVDQYLDYTGKKKSQLEIDAERPDWYFAPFAGTNYYNDVAGSIHSGMNEMQAKNFEGKFALAGRYADMFDNYETALKNKDGMKLLNEYYAIKKQLGNTKNPREVDVATMQTRMFDITNSLQQMYPDYFAKGDQKAYDNLYYDLATNMQKDDKNIDMLNRTVEGKNTKGWYIGSGIDEVLADAKRNLGLFLTKNPTIRRMAAGATVGAAGGAAVGSFAGGVGALPGAAIGGIIGAATGLAGHESGAIDAVSSDMDSDAWWTDDVNDGLTYMNGYSQMNKQQRQAARKKYDQYIDKRKTHWNNAIAMNKAEQQDAEKFWNISDYFKDKAASADPGLNWDNIMYTNMQQMGYSSASWDKQLASMVLSATGNPLAVALGSDLQYEASREENRAQVLEDLCKRVKKNLQNTPGYNNKTMYQVVMDEARRDLQYRNASEDDIMNAIGEGRWMPTMAGAPSMIKRAAIQKVVNDSAKDSRNGIIGVYERDMAATGTDALVNFALFSNKIPIGIGSKIGAMATRAQRTKFVKGALDKTRGVVNKAFDTNAGKWVAAKSASLASKTQHIPGITTVGKSVKQLASDIKHGSQLGLDAVSVPLGYAAKAATGTAKSVGRMIDRNGNIQYGVGWLWGKALDETSEMFRTLPAKLVRPLSKRMGTEAGISLEMSANKYTKKAAKWAAKQFLKENTSEAIEEGKQYLNGKAWSDGAEVDDAENFFDVLMSDLSVGSSLITSAAGIPFGAKWGLAKDDDELYANMVGGWLGGATHNMAINAISAVPAAANGAVEAFSEGRTHFYNHIVNNVMADHITSMNSYHQGSKLALQFKDKKSFDTQWSDFVEANNERRAAGLSCYTDEEIAEEKKYADKLYKNYTSGVLQQVASKLGINPNSQQYAKLASAYTMYQDRLADINEAIGQQEDDIERIANGILEAQEASASDEIKRQIFGDSAGMSTNAIVKAFTKEKSTAPKESNKVKSTTSEEVANMTTKQRKEHERRLKNDKKYREAWETRQQDENTEAAETVSVNGASDEYVQQESNVDTFKRGLHVIAEITALNKLLKAMDTPDENSDMKAKADVKWIKNKLKQRVEELKKSGNGEMIDKILENPQMAVDDVDQFNDLVEMYQQRAGTSIDQTAATQILQAMVGNTDIKASLVQAILGKKIKADAKGVLKALDNSMKHQHELVYHMEKEFQSRDARRNHVERMSKAEQTAVSQEVEDFLSGVEDGSVVPAEVEATPAAVPTEQPAEQSSPITQPTVSPVQPEEVTPTEAPQETPIEVPTAAPETQVEQQPTEAPTEAPAVANGENKGFGSQNSVFTEDMLNDALKQLHDIASGKNGLGMGVNPAQLLEIGIKVFGYFMEGGIRSFADVTTNVARKLKDAGFSENIVKELGKHFKEWYMSTMMHESFDGVAGEFDDPSTVRSTDVNQIIEDVFDEELVEAMKDEKWDEFKKKLAADNNLAGVYESVEDMLKAEHRLSDKVALVNRKDKTTQILTVFANKQTFTDQDGVVIVANGVLLSPEDRFVVNGHGASLKQLAVMSNIIRKQIEHNNDVEKTPSSHDYFVHEGGKIVLYPRVHTYMQDQYPRTAYENEQESINRPLIEQAVQNKDYNELKKIMKKERTGINPPSDAIIDKYIEILKQDGTQDQQVIDALTAMSSELTPGIAVDLGNTFDEIVRVYFDTTARLSKPLKYDTFKVQWQGREVSVSRVMTKEVFDEIIKDLDEFKKKHEGWVYHTAKHTWHTVVSFADGTTGRVAGETDIVVVDPAGNLHIVDTKTSGKGWVDIKTPTPTGVKVSNPFTDEHREIGRHEYSKLPDGTYVPQLNSVKSLHSTKRHYSMQLSMYYLMISTELPGLNFADNCLSLLPITLDYKYANVQAGAQINDAYIGRNNQPDEIDLDIQRDVVDGLLFGVNTQEATQQVISEKKNGVQSRINKLLAATQRLQSEIQDTVATIKESYGDTATDEFSSVVNQLQQLVDDMQESFKNELPDTLAQLEVLDNLCQQYEQTGVDIRRQFDEASSADFTKYEQPKPNARQAAYEVVRDLCQQIVDVSVKWASKDQNGRYSNQTEEIYNQMAELVNQLQAEVNVFRTQYDDPKELDWAYDIIRWFAGQVNPATQTRINRPEVQSGYKKRGGYADYNTADRTNKRGRGVEQSVSTDGKVNLKDVTGNDDFAKNSTFTVKGTYSVNQSGRSYQVVLVTPQYNGMTFSDIEIQIAQNEKGAILYNQIDNLRRDLKDGQSIVLTGITRTEGEIKNGASRPVIGSTLTEGVSIYDISLDKSQFTFGIAEFDKATGSRRIMTYGDVQQNGHRSKSSLFEFTQGRGVVGMMYAVISNYFKNADGTRPRPQITGLNRMTLQKGDIELLMQLFGSYNTKAYEVIIDDGDSYNIPLSYMDIINMYFPTGTWNPTYAGAMHVKPYGNQVTFTFEPSSTNNSGKMAFDLAIDSDMIDDSGETVMGRQALEKWLSTQSVHIDIERCMSRLGQATDNNHPFGRIAQFFRSPKYQDVKELRLGNSSIYFNRNDFSNPSVKGDQLGISGLAWMMRNGMIQTTYEGISNPRFSFSNAEIREDVPQNQDPVTDAAAIDILDDPDALVDPTQISSDDLFYDDWAADEHKQRGRSENPITESTVKRNMQRMFGSNVPVKVVDNIYRLFKDCSAHCVGCVRDGVIYLAENAHQYTEYHEAFHVVSKYLLPKRLRAFVINGAKSRMAELYGKDFADQATDRQLEEMSAEMCRLFFQNIDNIKFKYRRPFEYIRQHYNAFKQIGSVRLYSTYMLMNCGVLKHLGFAMNKKQDADDLARMQVRDAHLQHITDERMYDTLVHSIVYYVMKLQGIRPDGSNIRPHKNKNGEQVGGLSLKKEDIDKQWTFKNSEGKPITYSVRQVMVDSLNMRDPNTGKALVDDKGNLIKNEALVAAVNELLDNWDSVKPDIESYLGELGVDYEEKINPTNEEDDPMDDEGSIDTSDPTLSEHTKASYETSRQVKTSTGIKFMLSFIKAYQIDERGQYKAKSNELGLYEYMDMHDVLNQMFSDLHTVSSASDLMRQIEERANNGDKMYEQIYKLFKSPYSHLRKKDGSVNYRNEQIITQLYNLISCAQMEFKRLQAHKSKDGLYRLTIKDCDQDYEAKQIRKDWGRSLIYRADERGFFAKLEDGRIGIKRHDSIQKLGNIIDQIFSIRDQFTEANLNLLQKDREAEKVDAESNNRDVQHIETGFSIGGQDNIDVLDWKDLRFVKRELCTLLNMLGMQISYPELDYMLKNKYAGMSELDQMREFFQATGEGSIQGLTSVFPIVKSGGSWKWNVDSQNSDVSKRNNIAVKTVRTSKKSPDISAEDTYVNNSFAIELSNWKYKYGHASTELSVLVSDNKYYVMSDNNHISDVTNDISRGDDFVDMLSSFCYNISQEDDQNIGSIILKEAIKAKKEDRKLDIHICNPVQFKTDDSQDDGAGYFDIGELEDYCQKATILQNGGIIFPTMSDKKTWVYISGITLPGIKFKTDKDGQIQAFDNKTQKEDPLDDTTAVDQIIEYAKTELAAIKQTINDLKTIPEQEKVKNYHRTFVKDSLGKEHEIANGTIFSQLCGIYDSENNYISFNRVFDENGRYISPEENVKIAEREFFSKSTEERREIMRRIIDRQVDAELEHLDKIGAVAKNPATGGYTNLGFDSSAIHAIQKFRNTTIEDATRIYVTDTVRKSIMSISEVERVYSGHPGFFKYSFGKTTSGCICLVDRTADEFKRFGGLTSTGTNNNIEIEGLPKDGYNQAEIKDEEVVSDQVDALSEQMKIAEWYNAYIQLRTDMLVKEGTSRTSAERIAVDETKKKDDDGNATFTYETAEQYIKEHDNRSWDIITKKIADETSVYSDGKINVADGSAFISPDMTEWLLRMCGEFDQHVADAFKVLRDPKSDVRKVAESYKLVQTKVIGAQKYTAYGMRASRDGKTMVPYYNKMALFPVFESVATGEFAKVYQQMINNTDNAGNPMPIHVLAMESAVKFGNQGTQKYSADDTFKFNVYKQPFNRIRKQFNTNPKHHDDQSMGTQMVKVALSSLILGNTYKVGDRSISGEQLLTEIMNNIKTLSKEGYDDIAIRLFNADGTVNQVGLSKFLDEMLTSRDADKSIRDSISEKNGKLKHPLAAISRLGWLQSIIVSFINKRIIDVRTPGSAFYQRSIWKMEGADVVHSELPSTINGGKPLKTFIEDGAARGAMECVLTIDYFADILEDAGLKDASFEEQRAALMEAGVIGNDGTQWANLIGYRIPTQAQSSIQSFRCVDVVPVLNHNIFLPKDFTRITGSDFDIDKIFIASQNAKLVKTDGKWMQDEEYINSIPRLKAQNDLIQAYSAVLNDPLAACTGLRSIDKDTDLLHYVLKDLEAGKQVMSEVMPYDFYCLRTHTNTKNDFLTGKVGIGPFALNNNSQVLTTLYDVHFAEGSVMDLLGRRSLANRTDIDGQNILSWVSALINAHVDVAKDAYISRLNVNKMTYNLTNLLIRTGYGKRTFWFLCQPVMKQMAYEYNKSQGYFLQDSTKSAFQRQRDAKRKAAIDICGEDVVTKWEKYFDLDKGKVTVDHPILPFMNYILNSEDSHKIAKGNTSIDIDIAGQHLDYKDYQAVVYLVDKVLESPAQAISDLVQYSKIDTKKQGKNVSEQLAYARCVAKTFNDTDLLNELYGGDTTLKGKSAETAYEGQFDLESITRMYEQSFLRDKTHRAISTFMKIMDGQVFEACRGFQKMTMMIADYLGRSDAKSYQKIADALTGKIKSEFFNLYAAEHDIDIPSLVSGNNSIYNRLDALKIKIATDPEYADLRDANGEIFNLLLKSLISDKQWNYNSDAHPDTRPDTFSDLKFVRLFDPMDVSTKKRDYIIQAWEALLRDDNPAHEEVRKFAEDLCVYAFVTSADKTGRTKIFSYVPNYWREQSGYVDFIQDKLNDLQDPSNIDMLSDSFIDDVILNNWNDYTFVPSVEIYDQDPKAEVQWRYISKRSFVDGYTAGYPLFLYSSDKGISNDEIRPFVKVKRYKFAKTDGSHRSHVVFKLVATYPVSKTKSVPVYVKINPRGYSVDHYDYYEYGSNRRVDEEYFPSAMQFATQHRQEFEKDKRRYTAEFIGNIGELLNRIAIYTGAAIGNVQVEQWAKIKEYGPRNAPEATYSMYNTDIEVGSQQQEQPSEEEEQNASTNEEAVENVDTTEKFIKYTPIGKQRQTYKIIGSHIYNKDGKEVFKEDSADRMKIFANLAVKEGRAVTVEHNDTTYVVNDKDQIVSGKTGKLMKWDDNNGDRRAILQLAEQKFNQKNDKQFRHIDGRTTVISILRHGGLKSYIKLKGNKMYLNGVQSSDVSYITDEIKAIADGFGVGVKVGDDGLISFETSNQTIAREISDAENKDSKSKITAIGYKKLIDFLTDRFGIQAYVYKNENEYHEKTGKNIPDGIPVAFFDNGRVIILEDKFKSQNKSSRPAILAEEFLHPFVLAIQEHNTDLFNSLLQQSKHSKFSTLVSHIKNTYKHSPQSDVNNEIVTQVLSYYFIEKYYENGPKKIQQILKSVLKFIADAINKCITKYGQFDDGYVFIQSEELPNMTFDELAELVNTSDTRFSIDDNKKFAHQTDVVNTIQQLKRLGEELMKNCAI